MNDKKHEHGKQDLRAGFTLIEVLLVVAILGILAGVVVVNFAGRGEEARIRATRASISAICLAVDAYEVDTGRYPSSLDSLVRNDGAPAWRGPYLRGGVPTDSWGTPFSLTVQGRNYVVRSAGPDQQMGGEDDITSFINE